MKKINDWDPDELNVKVIVACWILMTILVVIMMIFSKHQIY